MSEKDFMVSSVGIPSVSTISKKPCYLIVLSDSAGKATTVSRFISLDKPDLLNGFIQVKGIYVSAGDDVIVKTFVDLVASSPKETIVDVMFPWHRIHSIRSLVFNANKPATVIR
jgi:hypothetical protein